MTDTTTTPTPETSPAPDGAGKRGRSSSSFGKSLSFSAGRGIILILVAIVIGVVLLRVVDDGSSSSKTATSATVATTPKASTTTTAKNTTGTTPQLTPTNQLTVLVLNGTGKTGVASTVSDKLGAAPLSYKMLKAANTAKQTGNTVYYTQALSGEAAALATAVTASTQDVTGVSNETKVEQVPATLPKDWQSADASKAQLVVVVGAK
ncbi:MAG: LytR C-terminal domain-containing protein [Acidimicrobiia bacterium]